jgi:hypothetical protein
MKKALPASAGGALFFACVAGVAQQHVRSFLLHCTIVLCNQIFFAKFTAGWLACLVEISINFVS